MDTPTLPTSCGYGVKEMREAEVVAAKQNRLRYGFLYDQWDDESPAAVNERMSRDLRDWLKGGGDRR